VSEGILAPDVGPDDHAQGPADAPVTLVEYGDYECPHCARAHRIVPIVQRELGDSLRFVFRNFPLQQAHPHAQRAAEAAESVAANAGEASFWKMHHLIFDNQHALTMENLVDYSAIVEADPIVVADDLSSGKMVPRVRRDFKSGVRSGVNGTPTFFVNGRRYDGDWTDPESFIADLQSLARSGAHR
jgi:protein-disulfide isomerase